jgi:hypothetical protein
MQQNIYVISVGLNLDNPSTALHHSFLIFDSIEFPKKWADDFYRRSDTLAPGHGTEKVQNSPYLIRNTSESSFR